MLIIKSNKIQKFFDLLLSSDSYINIPNNINVKINDNKL